MWACVAFVVMEPATALAHRCLMHGPGMVWHRSHHQPQTPGFEANDWFPVCFAGATMLAFALGLNIDGLRVLLPICIGVTLYGAAYALVHDGVIHQRVSVPVRGRYLRHVVASHALHHRFGAAPYGMLAPVVSRSTRHRAAASGGVRRERVGTAPRA